MICADSRFSRSSSCLGVLGVVQRLPNQRLATLERQQQRTPGELREQRQEDEKGDDRPDEQSRIDLDQRVIHDGFPSRPTR
jgi:hypothetical protein